METKTFKEVSEIWKRDKRQYVKPSSYSTYVLLLNKHILPVFGESTLVTESDVQSFVLKKLDEGLSTKSVKVLVLVLKMITRFGAKAGYWPVPDWSIHYPTEQVATNLDVLNRQDQKRILTHIKDHFTCRNLGIYICLSAGLRIGEVCASVRSAPFSGKTSTWKMKSSASARRSAGSTSPMGRASAHIWSWASRRRSMPSGKFRCPGR